MRFQDRADAGARLAAALRQWVGSDAVVVGLPRGGVPVAAEVARSLDAPLDVVVARKLGVPSEPELAMGAVGEEAVEVLAESTWRARRVTPSQLTEVERRELAEVAAGAVRFRECRAPLPLAGRTVIVVDDGVATGATAKAACRVVRRRGASRVVLAAPVGPLDVEELMAEDADDVVVPARPARFQAVSECYVDFHEVTDDEVVRLLSAARLRVARP